MDYDNIFLELGLKPFTDTNLRSFKCAVWQNENRRKAYDEVIEHEVIYRSVVSDNIEFVSGDETIDPALIVSHNNDGNIYVFNGHYTYIFDGNLEYTLREFKED